MHTCAWCAYDRTTAYTNVVKITIPASWVIILGCPDCQQIAEKYLCDLHGRNATDNTTYECSNCQTRMEVICEPL